MIYLDEDTGFLAWMDMEWIEDDTEYLDVMGLHHEAYWSSVGGIAGTCDSYRR